MFWILIEYKITVEELQGFLKEVLPEMKLAVKPYAAFISEPHADPVVVTLNDFSNVFKNKIEFWLVDKTYGIAFTQFLAERLSLKFQCRTVTELKAEGYPYNALLFVDKQKYVINDNGIELDNYVPQITSKWENDIKAFDTKGCLQH